MPLTMMNSAATTYAIHETNSGIGDNNKLRRQYDSAPSDTPASTAITHAYAARDGFARDDIPAELLEPIPAQKQKRTVLGAARRCLGRIRTRSRRRAAWAGCRSAR